MKKFFSKKMLAAWIVAFLVGLYSTFVALCLWNLFAVPILHLPRLSFLQLWGLMLLPGILMRGSFHTNSGIESGKWTTLCTAIEMCIPDDKQQTWKEHWQMEPVQAVMDSIEAILGTFATNTLVLILGFILYAATL